MIEESVKRSLEKELAVLLQEIVVNDSNYEFRNKLILMALVSALHLGYLGGIGTDPEEPGWPVIFIDLPAGQISWHIPEYQKSWDGHTTAMKMHRIEEYVKRFGSSVESHIQE